MSRRAVECWTPVLWAGDAAPQALAAQARRFEAEGWDGATVPDSQCIMPDVFVVMAAIALHTSRLGIGTGVAVPLTRHPAVTASAIAGIQSLSGGRAVLTIGRGDTALAYLGASPVRLAAFETFVTQCARYLAGELLPLDEVVPTGAGAVPGYGNLAVGSPPPGSKLVWLDPALPRVPVEVVATGPKALQMGGRIADRVALNVGTDPARVAWAISEVHAGARQTGRDPARVGLTLYGSVQPTDGDGARERDLVRPFVMGSSRFAVMDREVRGHVSPHQRAVMEKMMDSYDISHHVRKEQGPSVVDDAFVDSYAIIDRADACVERLVALHRLGIDRFVMTAATPDRPEYDAARQAIVQQVLPGLRQAV